ncbi:hypothetical protein MHB65_06875 [Lysinibacillus sp. FSL K6-0075]|uniref:hypothetical protein n=1 Tax=Lysinibacillus TaxID=400634 RepID=UPI002E1E92EA|nr:hypothetical protein [Lysinibacillus capsici]
MEKDKKVDTAATVTTAESKEYTETLEHGTKVKFLFSAEIENYSEEDFHELLNHFAKNSHNFYLFMGRKIIKK